VTEVLFYHLLRRGLEQVLPGLLEKCVERGWRTVVQAGTAERRDALDAHLWTYRDDSFLPHGVSREIDPADLPILLTADPAERGLATVRFLVDRAALPEDLSPYERVVLIFDGNDPEALTEARGDWKRVRAGGHACTYWAEDENGRFVKKA
jgi:DNA polymerase-3 subunit chi